MSPLAIGRAWDFGLEVVLRSSALLIMAGFAVRLLRREAAATRHLALSLLLVSLLLMPILSVTLPTWSLPWHIPTGARLVSGSALPIQGGMRRTPIMPGRSHRFRSLGPPNFAPFHRAVSGELRPHDYTQSPWVAASLTQTAPTGVSAPTIPNGTQHRGATDRRSQPTPSPLRLSTETAQSAAPLGSTRRLSPRHKALPLPHLMLQPCLLLAWLIGCGLELARLCAGFVGTRRLQRHCSPVIDRSIEAILDEIRQELGLNRAVTLLQAPAADRGSIPIIWGLLRPTLVLPADLMRWPQERLRAILLHELAHIARRDTGLQLIAQIVHSVYWFHPLARWAVRQHAIEAERACDDCVLLAGISPTLYATTLLEVIRTMKRPATVPKCALSIARPPIEKRLHAILTPHLRRNAARPAVTRTVFGAAFCALALASFRVGAAPERPARHLPASAVTAISPHQTPSPSHPPARSSATVHHASAHSGTHDAELSTMRRQLEQFRRLLLQNQQENRALRQEVKDQSARLHEIQNEAIRILDPGLPPEHVGTQQHPPAQTNANHKLPLTALQQAEIESVKLTLSDLQQQRTLLQQRLEQARALYTAGASGPNPLTQTQAELKNNEYEIDSTSARLSDLEAGIHRSQQEIQRATLRTQLKKLRTYLVEQQGALRIASERHRAGLATAADVNDAQQSISRTRIEIDRLQLQLLESN